jgi:hypothetical protein
MGVVWRSGSKIILTEVPYWRGVTRTIDVCSPCPLLCGEFVFKDSCEVPCKIFDRTWLLSRAGSSPSLWRYRFQLPAQRPTLRMLFAVFLGSTGQIPEQCLKYTMTSSFHILSSSLPGNQQTFRRCVLLATDSVGRSVKLLLVLASTVIFGFRFRLELWPRFFFS